MRLVGGSADYEGRLEICVNNVWGTVCYGNSRYSYGYNYWQQRDGQVVCRQLGYQELGEIYTAKTVGLLQPHLGYLSCMLVMLRNEISELKIGLRNSSTDILR